MPLVPFSALGLLKTPLAGSPSDKCPCHLSMLKESLHPGGQRPTSFMCVGKCRWQIVFDNCLWQMPSQAKRDGKFAPDPEQKHNNFLPFSGPKFPMEVHCAAPTPTKSTEPIHARPPADRFLFKTRDPVIGRPGTQADTVSAATSKGREG